MRRVEHRLAERLQDLRPALEERVRLHQELRRDVKGLEKLSQKEKARAHEARERRAQESLDEVGARRSLPRGGKSFRASRP
jgi:flagellar biosynthesis chaperone FliJ